VTLYVGQEWLDHIPIAAMALLEDIQTPPERDHLAFNAWRPRGGSNL
jgi:hypothetical protein